VTAQGSAYHRFRRALDRGKVTEALSCASELEHLAVRIFSPKSSFGLFEPKLSFHFPWLKPGSPLPQARRAADTCGCFGSKRWPSTTALETSTSLRFAARA
jgi:hypothetical protein